MAVPSTSWQAHTFTALTGFLLGMAAGLPWWASATLAGIGNAHFAIDHAASWEDAWTTQGIIRFSQVGWVCAGVLILSSPALLITHTVDASISALLAGLVFAALGPLSAGTYSIAGAHQSKLDALPHRWTLPNGNVMLKGWTSYAEFGFGAVWGLAFAAIALQLAKALPS